MMKIERPLVPKWLQENYENWGEGWAARLAQNSKAQFHWHSKYDKFLVLLLTMTDDHCTFCDGFPLKSSGATIEHFRPKTKFPLQAYEWENLFPCCGECQKKNDNFDENLLKPDAQDYDFNTYFVFNYRTGEIEINPSASLENQARAAVTRTLYRFNDADRPQTRLKIFNNRHYKNLAEEDLSMVIFRFMFQ